MYYCNCEVRFVMCRVERNVCITNERFSNQLYSLMLQENEHIISALLDCYRIHWPLTSSAVPQYKREHTIPLEADNLPVLPTDRHHLEGLLEVHLVHDGTWPVAQHQSDGVIGRRALA